MFSSQGSSKYFEGLFFAMSDRSSVFTSTLEVIMYMYGHDLQSFNLLTI